MRIVVKVGSVLLSSEQTTSGLDETFIGHLVQQLGGLHQQGHKIALVTSGAVATGRVGRDEGYPVGRAAMVGQVKLMATYLRFFEQLSKKIPIAQALYTYHDLESSDDELRTKQRLLEGFKCGEITIINANDAVMDQEIQGLSSLADNDKLAAKVAILIECDLLIMLTSVDGLYRYYGTSKQELIKDVPVIDDEILKLAQGPGSSLSKGGMESKVEAAKSATSKGVEVVVANGKISSVLLKIVDGGPNRPGTLFWAQKQFCLKLERKE